MRAYANRCSPAIPGAILVAMIVAPAALRAQVHFASGQDVVPVYEGWERNPDGSFNMVFGYMNRNYEEQLDIPVGAANKFEPGDPDRGQPAHFYPRRQEFSFKVKVPKDWGDKDLVWTLQRNGKVEKAYGTLTPIWELGTLVYLENRRGAGALTFPEEPNKPPSAEMVGSSARSVVAGEPLTLTVEVADDGYPIPRVRHARPARREGDQSQSPGPQYPQSPATQAVVKLEPGVRLGVTWVVYRNGPGTVTFDPMHVAIVRSPEDGVAARAEPLEGKGSTRVVFSEPGTYQLRAYADDSVLTAPLDVTVQVTAAEKAGR